MNSRLLKVISPLISFVRTKSSRGYIAPGGLRYPGGIVYYPRNPDHKDPEYTPSKLFRVERIKSPRHHPFWQKNILKELNILDGRSRVTIVKNIPENNSRLWKVKHLIKVTPIVFPYGEPTEEDINYTILKENGECVVTKKLEPKQNQIEAFNCHDTDAKKMDAETLKRDSRHKWNNAFSGGF